ncbi:MAG: hypothetical protein IPN68_16880 [Bacteroidetes bacterium]|nr:hypothetical protein [Bacteroidota bacterium]
MINNWCSSDAAYTTVGASADKNKGTCWANGPNYNRWFKFQATSTNIASIKLKTGGAKVHFSILSWLYGKVMDHPGCCCIYISV